MGAEHQHLNEAIERYLSTETNFAVLLSGSWGSGKTYYYDNYLVEIIKNVNVFGDENNTYTPIKVSLFGKRNIAEITSDIYTQLYPYLEKKLLKKGGKIVMNAAIGYIKNKTTVDLNEYISDDLFEIKRKIKYQQIVICFDDLEKKSKELKFEEVIGYINSLVENDKTKVIIIANEDKINSKVYNTIKEKTIGITLEFNQSLEAIYGDLIFSRYAGEYIEFHQYLIDEEKFILNLLSNANKNLRYVIFALDILNQVYNEYLKVENNKNKDKTISIVTFTVSISIEYRRGELTKNNGLDLAKLHLPSFDESFVLYSPNEPSDVNEESKQNGKTDVRSLIIDNYYLNSYQLLSSHDYQFYPHIFDFITLSIFLNHELLRKDLEDAFPKYDELPDHLQVLNDLHFENLNVLSHSYKEYISKTSKLIKFATEGKYKILEVFSVFHFGIRFNNPLNLNIDKFVDSLIKGMKQNKHNEYSSILEYDLEIKENDTNVSHLKKLIKEALNINNHLKIQQDKVKAQAVIKLLDLDLKQFSEEISIYNRSEFYYRSIFYLIKPKKFFKYIKSYDYENLRIVYILFDNRYRRNMSDKENYQEEIPFFESLKNLLSDYINRRGNKTMLNYQINLILCQVEKILKILR